MGTKLVVLRNRQPLFEYLFKAEEEDASLVADASIALAVFRRLNPTVSLSDPEITVSFEKSEQPQLAAQQQQQQQLQPKHDNTKE